MKRFTLMFILTAIIAVSCQTQPKTFTVNGTYDTTGSIFSVSMLHVLESKDTVWIGQKSITESDNDGVFTFSGEVETPYIAYILFKMRSVIFMKKTTRTLRKVVFVEGGEITANITKAGKVAISGGKLNDLYDNLDEQYNNYLKEIDSLPRYEQAQLVDAYWIDVIEKNLNNPLGLFILKEKLIIKQKCLKGVAETLFSKFSKQMRESAFASTITPLIENLDVYRIGVGDKYIDFTLPDVNDNEVSLSSMVGEGKWVLIDFWATWCPACVAQIPSLKEAYEKYHPYGLEICTVSLDREPEKWREYSIKTMPWVDLLRTSNEVTKNYQVRLIPTNFLISPDGVIVAKDLKGKDIELVLSKLLKK